MKAEKSKKLIKTIIVFVAFLLVCFIGGYIAGALLAHFDVANLNLGTFWENFNTIGAYVTPILYFAMVIIVSLVCFFRYQKVKKAFELWDGENEDEIRKIEKSASISIFISNVSYVLYMFLFGLCDYFERRTGVLEDVYYAFPITMLLGIILTIVIQRMYVELEKKINPEKRGEILDVKFMKDWTGSFDEAEKVMMYKAAYKAFRATVNVCSILWIVCLIGGIVFDLSIIPLAVVTIVWLTNIIAYQIECVKYDSK